MEIIVVELHDWLAADAHMLSPVGGDVLDVGIETTATVPTAPNKRSFEGEGAIRNVIDDMAPIVGKSMVPPPRLRAPPLDLVVRRLEPVRDGRGNHLVPA
jgi:hypothetical protein